MIPSEVKLSCFFSTFAKKITGKFFAFGYSKHRRVLLLQFRFIRHVIFFPKPVKNILQIQKYIFQIINSQNNRKQDKNTLTKKYPQLFHNSQPQIPVIQQNRRSIIIKTNKMEYTPYDSPPGSMQYSPTYPIRVPPNKDITFHHSNTYAPSQNDKSQSNIRLEPAFTNSNNLQKQGQGEKFIEDLYQRSEEEGSQMNKSIQSQISHQSAISAGQVEANIKTIERLWEYRYVCLIDNALKTNDWFRVFSFICEFKMKCIELVKDLIHSGLQNTKTVDEIDHRYNLKGDGEEGIYLIDGIIVRVARIKSKKQENGKIGFDYSAMKALHQEFLSLNILNNLSISLVKDMPKLPRIRVPLSCLVKYMGYTVLCQADSPCQGLETLVHGPIGTIYQYREEYMNMLRIIGHSLNLKEFTMLSSDKKSVTIPFSLTLQLHKITKYLPSERMLNIIDKNSVLFPKNSSVYLDQPQFYLMSVAKLWPLFIDSDIIKSVGYLRPEVVISSKTPLSNVVFCEVSQKPDPEGELQLADACKRVKQDHISALAKLLDNTTVFLVDSVGIEDLMHQYGINIRYIGSLAQKVNLEFNKRILETEMLVRVCKRYFFKTFHQIIHENKIQGNQLLQEFKECFIDFLNLIFIKSKQAEKFYKTYLYPEIQRYYDYKITAYPPQLAGGGILHALCFHFGIKFKIVQYPFFQDLQTIFNTGHILDIQGSAKGYDLETAEIKQICKKYKDKRKKGQLNQCIRELKILSKIHSIQCNEKTEPIAPLPEAYFLTELAEVYFKMNDTAAAKEYSEMALKAMPEKHSDCVRPFQILLKYYCKRKENNKGVQFYEKSLNYLIYHLGTNHPLTITVYNSYAYEQLDAQDPTKCEKMFLKSLQICEHSLGYTHATSSQILLQLAQLPLPPQKRINYYLQGLNVLQNLDGGEAHAQKIRRVCMRIAEIYQKVGNLDKMIFFAKRSGYWQLQIKGQSKQQLHRSVLLLANRTPTSIQQCKFIANFAFRSYVKLLPKASREYLYKLFVSIRDKLLPSDAAAQLFLEGLRLDKVNMMTVTQQLKNIINHLTTELPSLIQKPTFYKDLLKSIDVDDKKLRNSVQVFTAIVSTVGQQKSEKYLTQMVRKL